MREMRAFRCAALLGCATAFVALGCASSSAETGKPVDKPTPPGPVEPAAKPAPAGKVEFASCGEHLEAIAKCFFEVVTQIQREPREGEPIARFLGEATWQIAAGHVHAACTPLGLDARSTRLLLGDGSEVLVAKSEESRDEMFGGATVWHFVYRFASPTCEHTAEIGIDLWAGGPVE
jgi:hypothetical protein